MTMSAKPGRRRHFPVPPEWEAEFTADLDPEDHEHYRKFRILQRVLREEYDVRPEVMHPTRNHRGVVTVTLPELYWLIFVPEDQPPLVCTGAPVTAEGRPGRFGSPREVQHAQEITDARELLFAEFGFAPESAAPTQDFKGRIRLTFAELEKILEGVQE